MSNCNTASDHSQTQTSLENEYKRLSSERAEELEKQFKEQESILPEGFFFSDNKLMYLPASSNEDEDPAAIFICSKLEVTAYIRDDNNENYGKLLTFEDPENHVHRWPLAMELIAGDGTKYRAALLNRGLEISMTRKAQTLLSVYIANSKPKCWIRCISQLGWYKDHFILPEETLGRADNEQLVFQNPNVTSPNYTQRGTVEEWIDNVAKLCIKNSLLEFAVSCAFASPLLHLRKIESGGFHLRGESSIGKSKILAVARSVWSNNEFLQIWNATINGLEAIAPGYNDALLCLDEIGQVDAAIAGETAYMLANEKGKLRANKFGSGRDQLKWRLLFLSNGEISLAEHMLQAGKKAKAGQEIRILDIPANTGKFGSFEVLHGYASGENFADALSEACSNYYGTVSRADINKIIEDRDFAISFSKNIQKIFIGKYKPEKASGQVVRALNRFALVAAGGELATTYGLTGWAQGAAMEGVGKCFIDWLFARGGVDSKEKMLALKQVRNFFELNWRNKFKSWDTALDKDLDNIESFRKVDQQGKSEFFVHPTLFKTEICLDVDPTILAKWCIEEGLIHPSTDGKFTRSEQVSVNQIKGRFYRFTSKVLEGLGPIA